MARNWVVLTADRSPHMANEIIAYTTWDGYPAAADEVVYTDPVDVDGNAVDEAWKVSGSVTLAAGVYTYSDPAGTPTQADLWINDLAEGYRGYLRVRTESWVSRRVSNFPRRPMVATDRWAYSQIALGDALARSTWLPALTGEQRGTAIAHIADLIDRIGAIWYGVIAADAGSLETDWAAVNVTDSAPIYSDIINPDGTPRAPDGAFTLLVPTALIPAGFNPDSRTLR